MFNNFYLVKHTTEENWRLFIEFYSHFYFRVVKIINAKYILKQSKNTNHLL